MSLTAVIDEGVCSMSSTLLDTPNTIPLTAGQKARLILDCVPFLVFVVMLLFSVAILPNLVGEIPVAFYLFMGLVILVVGFQAVQRFHDLSGVAVVEEDVLIR